METQTFRLNKDLSMQKIVNYLVKNPSKIIELIVEIKNYNTKVNYHLTALAKYCSYDKRERKNFEQETINVFNA